MKRFFAILFSMAALVSATIFVSCSNDDSSSGGDDYYIGGGNGNDGEDNDWDDDGNNYDNNDWGDYDNYYVPSAPQNVTAKGASSSSIKVSWDAVDGADSYVVYYRLDLGAANDSYEKNGTESTKTTSDTSVLINGLTEWKIYLFWVTAKNSAGESRESDVKFAYPNLSTSSGGSSSGSGSSGTTTTKLSAPTWLNAYEDSSTHVIRLSWDSVIGATGYEVYRSVFSSPSYASLIETTTETSTIISGTEANKKYYFWVKATNGTQKSNWSPSDYVITEGTSQSPSLGALKIINNSSYDVKNVQIYTTYSSSLSGVILGGLDVVISSGYSHTFQNIAPGTYVRLGSEAYRNHKISTEKTVVIQSGATTTLTITDDDIK